MTSPAGKTISGNFKYVFDLKDKVYAISTLRHLDIASTSIYRFDNDKDVQSIYGTSDWLTVMVLEPLGESTKDYYENLSCDAVYVNNDEAYAVLSGLISKKSEPRGIRENDSVRICRMLKIKDGKVKQIKEYAGKVPSLINSIIVDSNKFYVGCDKMVCIYDLDKDGSVIYRTCISPEDEKDILATEKGKFI